MERGGTGDAGDGSEWRGRLQADFADVFLIPNNSDLTSPLTDLTKKEVPDPVQWTELCQQTFTQVKAALCGGPLLHSPDFSLPFLLQTDASDRGLGAILSQEVGGEERPVLYISRKLWKRDNVQHH